MLTFISYVCPHRSTTSGSQQYAVLCNVVWTHTVLTFVDHCRQFEDDSWTNWKPMQISKNGSDMIVFPCVRFSFRWTVRSRAIGALMLSISCMSLATSFPQWRDWWEARNHFSVWEVVCGAFGGQRCMYIWHNAHRTSRPMLPDRGFLFFYSTYADFIIFLYYPWLVQLNGTK